MPTLKWPRYGWSPHGRLCHPSVISLQLGFVTLFHLQKEDPTAQSIHKECNPQQDSVTVRHLTLRVFPSHHWLSLVSLRFPKSVFPNVTLSTVRASTQKMMFNPPSMLLHQASLPSPIYFILLCIYINMFAKNCVTFLPRKFLLHITVKGASLFSKVLQKNENIGKTSNAKNDHLNSQNKSMSNIQTSCH